ncbi:MAG: hypothetical protein ACTHOO_01595 [Alcanivorax sp.]
MQRLKIALVLFLSLISLAGCKYRPDTWGGYTHHVIVLKIDGKEYKIERKIRKWLTHHLNILPSGPAAYHGPSFSKSGYNDFGTFGKRLDNKQAVVIKFGISYPIGSENWQVDENGYKFSTNEKDLKRILKVYLLDHYKDPKIIELYENRQDFDSINARVEIKYVSIKRFPKSIFGLFSTDWKDRYYDFDLKGSSYIPDEAKKVYESRTYFKSKVSEKSMEQILKEFPQIIEHRDLLAPNGIYRLEGKYQLQRDGSYKEMKGRAHRGSRIFSLAQRDKACDISEVCIDYRGEKENNSWVMYEKGRVRKIYRTSNPLTRSDYFQKKSYDFELDGKIMTFEKDPEYRNSYLNLDTGEFTGFYIGQHYIVD